MDLLSNLLIGLGAALTPYNLLFCFVGTFIGTMIGVLPGIGPAATVALLLPLTFVLDPLTGLIMIAGIYYGAQYGGSTTAILINVPGESSSAVTAIDGYQMARRGRAGPALVTAAIGSFFAGTVGTLLIALFGPPLTAVALSFGPPEYCALIILGLIVAVALARGSVLKALAMVMVGLLLGSIGTDIYTGTIRLTFGIWDLQDGVGIVALAVGVFGISEILRNLQEEMGRSVVVEKVTGLFPTREDLKRMTKPILRGTALGCILGILPGGGLTLSTFSSYALEKRLAKNRSEFGHGALEGVAGPESANNAAAQTSFIPMLTLGLPSHPVMALMLGAMIVHGIQPGPNVIINNPTLFWGIIVSMWVGNLFLVILNLPLVGIWVRLLKVPYDMLVPVILLFSSIGIFSVSDSVTHLCSLSVFGGLGYLLFKVGCEPAPLLLGFILGPLLEEHLRRSMLIARGNPIIFIERPLSAVMLVFALALLIFSILPMLRRRRQTIFEDSDD